MGCKIDDEEFKAVLVMSLPQSWDHFISSYQGTHLKPNKEDDRSITSQELTSVLIDEYQCHLDSGIVPENRSHAFYAQPSTGNKKRKVEIINKNTASTSKIKCTICGRDNHPTFKCHFKGKPKCGKCGKFSHQMEKCWGNNPPGKKAGKGKECKSAMQVEEDAEMSYVANNNVSEMNEDSVSFYPWYADSATTSHITHEKSAFIDYKPITPIPIYGLGKSYIWAYGHGTVEAISLIEGKLQLLYLKETLFTPEHPDNLLSIGKIDVNGGKIIFGNHKAVLYDNKNNVVVEGKLSSNQLYPLNIYRRTHAETSNITTINHQLTWDEWHRKYGHIGTTGLKHLLINKLVDGFEVDETSAMGDCDACIQAKQSHAPFPKIAKSRSEKPGELTHTDVWGPAHTTSWSKMWYNITFIDDCTRHCMCKQMENKDEASIKLQQYLVLIECQYGYIPKRV